MIVGEFVSGLLQNVFITVRTFGTCFGLDLIRAQVPVFAISGCPFVPSGNDANKKERNAIRFCLFVCLVFFFLKKQQQ